MKFHTTAVILSVLTLAACLPGKKADQNGAAASEGIAGSSAAPVMMEDGVTMKDGMMLTVKEGQMSRMLEDVEYDDGTTVKVDGTVVLADGTTLVLPEGMMITVDGRLQMREDFAVQGNPVIAASETEGDTKSAASAGTQAATEATYTGFTADVLNDGETKVLFFHAAWCPECKEANVFLQSILPSSEYSRSVYKVDYDTAKDLKAKYGVVYQHTFVVVDGNGVKLSSVQGPTEEQLAALLQ